MIQLNLLPSVKLGYIKAQQSRRLVITVSIFVSGAAIILLILLLLVDGLQKKHLSDLTSNINKEAAQLQSQPNIASILTSQSQLSSLTALHSGKPAASQLFGYLNQVTPSTVQITNLSVDFTQQIMTLTGTANNLGSVNDYVDTLKATTYTSNINTTKQSAFNKIVLSSFSPNIGTAGTAQAASYSITLGFDRNIFDITQTIKLEVPPITTTHAFDQSPNLFQQGSQ